MSSASLNFFDKLNALIIPTSGSVLAISTISAGFGDQTTLGGAIQAEYIDLHLALITVQQAPNGTSDMIRISVVQDLQSNGSTPNTNDLFATSGSSPVVDHRNYDNDDRFIWWHDEVIDINVYGSLGSNTIQTTRFVERSIPILQGPRTVYPTGSSAAESGAFFLVLSSYQGVTVGEAVTRLWYKYLGK